MWSMPANDCKTYIPYYVNKYHQYAKINEEN